ncbi:LLM class flavin-dependent oxidoreductase [Pseudactinotalea terrae]|uniref:LLM class flavin-dependent oxidoreductase n=1 Tax=Pseudactinotalea terrae TaxID=1743262 RepID=UPI001F501C35|nr:LLM class flavin-dependent oxidoreductase [Pseudactinotalea terrae]
MTTTAHTSADPDAPSAPTGRRIGVMLPRDLPSHEVLDFARQADSLGFDELWVLEDLGFRGGVAQAAAVLAVTSRITVGIGIAPAAARHAAFAAMEIATLGQLFPGRIVAGLGHGMPAWMRSLGLWPASPLTLLEETATAVRSVLRGEAVPQGRYVTLEHQEFTELPDVVPPVLLGVRGPRSLGLSGRIADGTLLAEPAPPTYIRAALSHIAATGPHHQLITYDVAAVSSDSGQALEAVRPGLAYIGEPDWAPHLVDLDFADDLAALRAQCESPQEFARKLPLTWVDALSLAGTPEGIRAKIAARHDAGATSVVLTPVGEDRRSQLEQLAQVQ